MESAVFGREASRRRTERVLATLGISVFAVAMRARTKVPITHAAQDEATYDPAVRKMERSASAWPCASTATATEEASEPARATRRPPP